jgi:hypothetical protein
VARAAQRSTLPPWAHLACPPPRFSPSGMSSVATLCMRRRASQFHPPTSANLYTIFIKRLERNPKPSAHLSYEPPGETVAVAGPSSPYPRFHQKSPTPYHSSSQYLTVSDYRLRLRVETTFSGAFASLVRPRCYLPCNRIHCKVPVSRHVSSSAPMPPAPSSLF